MIVNYIGRLDKQIQQKMQKRHISLDLWSLNASYLSVLKPDAAVLPTLLWVTGDGVCSFIVFVQQFVNLFANGLPI